MMERCSENVRPWSIVEKDHNERGGMKLDATVGGREGKAGQAGKRSARTDEAVAEEKNEDRWELFDPGR
jgi:hypothetical protein